MIVVRGFTHIDTESHTPPLGNANEQFFHFTVPFHIIMSCYLVGCVFLFFFFMFSYRIHYYRTQIIICQR